jgi:hypothetical protein
MLNPNVPGDPSSRKFIAELTCSFSSVFYSENHTYESRLVDPDGKVLDSTITLTLDPETLTDLQVPKATVAKKRRKRSFGTEQDLEVHAGTMASIIVPVSLIHPHVLFSILLFSVK